MIMIKKNRKWWLCVDYRELNKETKKKPFPFPFIGQVLDTFVGKKYFYFLDGFSGFTLDQSCWWRSREHDFHMYMEDICI